MKWNVIIYIISSVFVNEWFKPRFQSVMRNYNNVQKTYFISKTNELWVSDTVDYASNLRAELSSSAVLLSLEPVAHAYNPSYLGGRDQEDHGSRPGLAKSSWYSISTNDWLLLCTPAIPAIEGSTNRRIAAQTLFQKQPMWKGLGCDLNDRVHA
jgi:hypothetical protein